MVAKAFKPFSHHLQFLRSLPKLSESFDSSTRNINVSSQQKLVPKVIAFI
jgi:hypothetical protein